MRISKLFGMAINDLKKNKSNFLFIVILIILNVTIFVGFSYYECLVKFWKSKTEKSYDFNIAFLYSSERLEEAKESKHVLDIFYFDEYNEFGTINKDLLKDLDGSIRLIGSIPNMKKIVSGSDLSIDDDEMNCPNNFYPE